MQFRLWIEENTHKSRIKSVPLDAVYLPGMDQVLQQMKFKPHMIQATVHACYCPLVPWSLDGVTEIMHYSDFQDRLLHVDYQEIIKLSKEYNKAQDGISRRNQSYSFTNKSSTVL